MDNVTIDITEAVDNVTVNVSPAVDDVDIIVSTTIDSVDFDITELIDLVDISATSQIDYVTINVNVGFNAEGSWPDPVVSPIKEVEIDVGDICVTEATVNVIDGLVQTTSKILGGVAYKTPTGKDLDELDMDVLDILFKPLAGSIDVKIRSMTGSVAGRFVLWYTFS